MELHKVSLCLIAFRVLEKNDKINTKIAISHCKDGKGGKGGKDGKSGKDGKNIS